MLLERFHELELKLAEEVRNFYGGRAVALAVYGSVGRGTCRFDSDLDVLLVATGLPDGRMPRIGEFEAVEAALEPFLASLRRDGIDTRVSAVIRSPEEVASGSPLLFDMVDDARLLIDRGDFMATVLAGLRSRMTALGSKRIWRGNTWHWVLKPDLKPGERLEL